MEIINNHDGNYDTGMDVLSSTLSRSLCLALYVHYLAQGSRALQGRIYCFHFKDEDAMSQTGHIADM